MKLREIALTPPIVAIIISIGLMFDASATDRYVTAELDYGWGKDGKPVEGDKIYDKLQAAIKDSSDEDTIWLKDGFVSEETYSPKASGWGNNVGIYLNKKAITIRSVSGDARTGNPPALKGKPPTTVKFRLPDGRAIGSGAVCAIYVKESAATFMGIVFEGGSTTESQSSSWGGGGVMMANSPVVFDKCVFRNNNGGYGGGALAKTTGWDDAPTYTDCVFSNNWAWFQAAAAYGRATYERCEIINNGTTNTSSQGWCSGVCGAGTGFNARARMYDCIVSNNVNNGAKEGGALEYVRAVRTLVADNATRSGSGAGAIYSTLVDCEVRDNEAKGSAGGGGVFGCILTNCLVHGNSAGGSGGGVYGGTTIGCVISNNSAKATGGGMYFSSLAYTNIGNRIVYNRATSTSSGGAGIFARDGGSSYGCLIAFNDVVRTESSVTAAGVSSTWTQADSGKRYSRLVNCTVVSNSIVSTKSGSCTGGVFQGNLVNTIVIGNTLNRTLSNLSSIPTATNSCSPTLTRPADQAAGCTTADPKFRRGCVY